MLKKINRGLSRKDFEISRLNGRMIQTPLFGVSVVTTASSAEAPAAKVGFVISKKISKRAVDRNRIRRRICEVIKNKLPATNKVVFLVKRNILEAGIEDIRKCWEMVYEKISS